MRLAAVLMEDAARSVPRVVAKVDYEQNIPVVAGAVPRRRR